MKRLLLSVALLALSSALPGCPIYANDGECVRDSECAPGYACDFPSGECLSTGRVSCDAPADCEGNLTCGRDGRCQAGDCTFAEIGCVAGYTCSAASGRWRCVSEGNSGAGGASAEAGAGGGDSGGTGSAGEASGGAAGADGSQAGTAGAI